MKPIEHVLVSGDSIKLELNPREVYRVMGGGESEANPQIEAVVNRFRSQALKLLKPQGTYVILPVEVTGKNQVLLDKRFPLTVNTRFFAGASHAALALVTVGQTLELESSRLFAQGDFLEGFALDACGTVALDETLGVIRREIARGVTPLDYKLGYTLSPGCQMIPLEDQVIIFSLLDFEQLEVNLSDSYVMFPTKSLSVIIPLGSELSLTNKSNYACEVCSMQRTCTFTQKPKSE